MAGGYGESPGKKEKSKSGCPESKKSGCPESKKDKTSKTGKDAFGRNICLEDEKEKEPECHESRKRFFENSDKKSKDKKIEKQDKESKVEKKDCADSTKKMEVYTCKSASGSSNCCFSASKGSQSSCGEKVGSSKKSEVSKTSEKQHVESSAKPKPPSSTDKDEGLHVKLPDPRVLVVRPCLPKVEKSIAAKLMRKKKLPPCFTEKKSCPQLTKAMMSEFFCIDARNKRMNECIKHYMATDPSQVLVQCSQFAKRRKQPAAIQQPPPAGLGLIPPKYRQIIRRWLPAAGLYVVTTAAVAAWVTEWGPVVNRIPFYKDKEPKEVPSPDEMLAPETPLQELPPGFENVVPKDPQGSHPAEGSETVESSSLPAESELPPEMPASSEESSDPPAAEAPVPAAGTGT